ncbi:MAG: RsmD family RNA methyltransferase [Pirellulaceae bacterium]|nr:RsmD family RNA methyltransferase [Pirellulaceae bacterium]
MSRKKSSPDRSRAAAPPTAVDKPLRIIGGHLRNRPIHYSGDPRTRPMKDRVREALFNLIGPQVEGRHVIDLFAGTGALGLEAISRGAARATFIERHFPTARVIRENIASLGVETQCQVFAADTFLWLRQQRSREPDLLTGEPWLVLCSPPFDFYIDRLPQMHALLSDLRRAAPSGSLFAVEADQRFEFAHFSDLGHWHVRHYPPAVLGIATTDSDPTAE